MNNILSFIFGGLTEFLSEKWYGLIGLFGTAAGTVGVKETNDYLKAITQDSDYVILNNHNELTYYSDNDSLRAVIDSLQNLANVAKGAELHASFSTYQLLQYVLICLTIIVAICTIVGNMNKFIKWCKAKRNKSKEWDQD